MSLPVKDGERGAALEASGLLIALQVATEVKDFRGFADGALSIDVFDAVLVEYVYKQCDQQGQHQSDNAHEIFLFHLSF